MLDEIEADFAVHIMIEIQPTHTFDFIHFNVQGAMYHAELKRQMRKHRLPANDDELKKVFQEAADQISLDTIQRGFLRAYSKDENGDEDTSFIPKSLEGWYEEEISSDEDPEEDLNIDSEEVHTDEE